MNDDANRQQPSVPVSESVPVIEEELVTGTRTVKTGSVRIRKKVHRLNRTVDLPTIRHVVDVTRREINQVVTETPKVREEGDLLIIPVLEEEIVVTKRLILKEEICIRRRQEHSTSTKEVTVGREVATVERLDAEGRVVESPHRPVPVEQEQVYPNPSAPLYSESEPLIKPDPTIQRRVRRGLLD